MEWTDRLNDIKKRAEAMNLTLHGLCVEAGVTPSTLWRLCQSDADPRVKTIKRVLDPLEALIAKKEARLSRLLARRDRPRLTA
jgi:predicted transcriptional regulator